MSNNLLGGNSEQVEVPKDLVPETSSATEPAATVTDLSNLSPVPSAPTENPTNGVATNAAPAPSGLTVSSATSDKAVADYNAITDALLGSIGNIGTGSNFKCFLFSYPGRTKSSWAGEVDNNLIYDFEDGMLASLTAEKDSGRPRGKNVKSLPFKSLLQADELIDRLQDDHEAFKKWNVFTIDTISTMHKRMLEYVMRREKSKRPTMNEFDPQTEHYTEVNEVLTRFVQGICDIKTKDIIILAHAQTVEPKGKPAKTYADFSEKLYNKLAAKMDVVAFVEMQDLEVDGVKKPRPVFRFVSEGTIQAKNRLALPPEVLAPRWVDLKNVFEEARKTGQLTDGE